MHVEFLSGTSPRKVKLRLTLIYQICRTDIVTQVSDAACKPMGHFAPYFTIHCLHILSIIKYLNVHVET